MAPVIFLATPGPIGRDQARELARHELHRSIYHRDEPSILDRVLQKITDWLDSLLNRLPGNHAGGGGSWEALVVLLVLLILVAAAVWWRAGNIRRNAAERGGLLEDRPTNADDHRAQAELHAAAGEWAHAIRERLRAIARDLEERAILEPRPGRTADELAVEAGDALPGHADDLTAGVRVFDDVWYGGRTADADGYRRLSELDDRLRTARPAPLASAEAR
jgi:hypothetical protein